MPEFFAHRRGAVQGFKKARDRSALFGILCFVCSYAFPADDPNSHKLKLLALFCACFTVLCYASANCAGNIQEEPDHANGLGGP